MYVRMLAITFSLNKFGLNSILGENLMEGEKNEKLRLKNVRTEFALTNILIVLFAFH